MVEKPRGQEPDAASATGRRFTDAREPAATVIGRGTRIVGHLTADGDVDVGGSIEGDCAVGGLLRVREGAQILGDTTAANVVVEGELMANSLVADRVEVGASARVTADVRARRVAIADGGVLQGNVEMTAGEPSPLSFTEKRKG
jgi:cytoskeletal protein CcmA (bactofilin family)